MIPRPPRSTRTDTLFPYTPLFRSENATAIGPSPLRLVQAQRDIDDPAACPAEAAPKAVPTGLGGQFRQVQTGFPIGLLQRQRRRRSEEHTSELQSLMRISYAVFSLKKKNNATKISRINQKQQNTK